MMLEHLITSIKWQSEAQKKAFLNLAQHLKTCHPEGPDLDWRLAHVIAYLLQKDHEAAEWFSSVIGDQVVRLQQDIHTLRAETDQKLTQLRANYALEIAALREELDALKLVRPLRR